MAVAFDAQSTADSTGNSLTSINHTGITVGSGANRALVVTIVWSGATPTGITVTWDNGGTNQACTLITGAKISDGTFCTAACYGLVAPTSGAKQLNATWTGAADVCIAAVSYTGVNQTGGVTSFPNGTAASGATGTATVTVTSATGDAVVACHATDVSLTAVNNTQVYIDTAPNNISGGANRAAGAATVTMTATVSGASGWASAGTDVAASTGGSTTNKSVALTSLEIIAIVKSDAKNVKWSLSENLTKSNGRLVSTLFTSAESFSTIRSGVKNTLFRSAQVLSTIRSGVKNILFQSTQVLTKTSIATKLKNISLTLSQTLTYTKPLAKFVNFFTSVEPSGAKIFSTVLSTIQTFSVIASKINPRSINFFSTQILPTIKSPSKIILITTTQGLTSIRSGVKVVLLPVVEAFSNIKLIAKSVIFTSAEAFSNIKLIAKSVIFTSAEILSKILPKTAILKVAETLSSTQLRIKVVQVQLVSAEILSRIKSNLHIIQLTMNELLSTSKSISRIINLISSENFNIKSIFQRIVYLYTHIERSILNVLTGMNTTEIFSVIANKSQNTVNEVISFVSGEVLTSSNTIRKIIKFIAIVVGENVVLLSQSYLEIIHLSTTTAFNYSKIINRTKLFQLVSSMAFSTQNSIGRLTNLHNNNLLSIAKSPIKVISFISQMSYTLIKNITRFISLTTINNLGNSAIKAKLSLILLTTSETLTNSKFIVRIIFMPIVETFTSIRSASRTILLNTVETFTSIRSASRTILLNTVEILTKIASKTNLIRFTNPELFSVNKQIGRLTQFITNELANFQNQTIKLIQLVNPELYFSKVNKVRLMTFALSLTEIFTALIPTKSNFLAINFTNLEVLKVNKQIGRLTQFITNETLLVKNRISRIILLTSSSVSITIMNGINKIIKLTNPELLFNNAKKARLLFASFVNFAGPLSQAKSYGKYTLFLTNQAQSVINGINKITQFTSNQIVTIQNGINKVINFILTQNFTEFSSGLLTNLNITLSINQLFNNILKVGPQLKYMKASINYSKFKSIFGRVYSSIHK